MICQESIGRLIDIYKDDDKILKTIERCVTSFEEYHSRIFEMELWMKIYSKTVSGEEYKENVSLRDKARTMLHDSILGNVNLLNRLAERNNLPLVYDGIVSHERPYRREVANAVLEYVENLIKNRR